MGGNRRGEEKWYLLRTHKIFSVSYCMWVISFKCKITLQEMYYHTLFNWWIYCFIEQLYHCCLFLCKVLCLNFVSNVNIITKYIIEKFSLFVFYSQHWLPGWLSGEESICQCRNLKRCRFNPWVRKIPWKRKWQPASVFLPGKPYGQSSLVDCSPWGHKDLGMTEQLTLSFSLQEMKKTLKLETDYRSIGIKKICLQPVR